MLEKFEHINIESKTVDRSKSEHMPLKSSGAVVHAYVRGTSMFCIFVICKLFILNVNA